jgi:hypothetical protein
MSNMDFLSVGCDPPGALWPMGKTAKRSVVHCSRARALGDPAMDVGDARWIMRKAAPCGRRIEKGNAAPLRRPP